MIKLPPFKLEPVNLTRAEFRSLSLEGLWRNNPGLVQLLGLCPLLAVTNNVVNGLGLGLATIIVLLASNVAVSAVRNFIRQEVRIPTFILIIAANVTIIDMLMKAFFHDLYNILGIFIPLIVTNCAVLGRSEAFASKHEPVRAGLDSLMMGIGFMLVLMVLGGMRELVANGTLFSQAHLMFGEAARGWVISFGKDFHGLLLAALPPGAFIGLGLLVAMKNSIDQRLRKPVPKAATVAVAPSATAGEAA
ncbi:MAG: electron transport complex subunit E [Candidatus Thiothrix moscowensis]|nr:electron transport complex subunit E [Candidatus Thiothrix moscowensis]